MPVLLVDNLATYHTVRTCMDWNKHVYLLINKKNLGSTITHTGAKAKVDAYFGIGIGPILLFHKGCYQYSTDLLSCDRERCDIPSCTSHNHDVGIICQGIP